MEEFLDNIKVLINALGYKVLEPLRQVSSSDKEQRENLLYLKAGSADAIGTVTAEGFVVLAGAKIKEMYAIPLMKCVLKFLTNS